MKKHWESKYEIKPDRELCFIYAIQHKLTGKTYYGRKQFRNRRGRKWADSNWGFYTGSSRSLNEDIKANGHDTFKFIIISTFRTKTGMALGECTAIICSGCLEQPDRYYNRSAPSIRGSLRITPEDARGLERIREFI